MNEIFCILNWISVRFIPKGTIDSELLSEPMIFLTDDYMRVGLGERSN